MGALRRSRAHPITLARSGAAASPGITVGAAASRHGGKGLHAPPWGHQGGLQGPLQPVGAAGQRPSLRMQVCPQLASLPDLALASLRSQDDISSMQSKLFSGAAGETPSLRLA